ncbi:MAG: hypothetical protein AMS16_01110, partial [Planctomycetes bacterium DG_58]
DSPRTESVMLSTGLFQLGADYSMQNYYPYPRRSSRMHFGPFTQFAARDFGRGRVAAYTDSTTLSNFSALHPGRAELVLATVDWVGRTHSRGTWRWVLGSLGVLLLAGAVTAFLWLPDRVGGTSLLAAGVVFGCAVALAVVRTSVRGNFALPKPHTKPTHVAFLREGCEYELPIEDFVRDREKSFDLVYQWVLRLRYFPRVRRTLADALQDDLVVMVNPVGGFGARDLRRLHRYVESGGKVLVLLRQPSATPALKRLFDMFDLRVDPGPFEYFERVSHAADTQGLLDIFQLEIDPSVVCRRKALVAADGQSTGVVADGVVVRGGKTLYRMAGLPVAAMYEAGDGKLLVIGFGELFRDSAMGHTNATLPDEQLKARFRLLFKLLQFLLPPEEHLPQAVLHEVKTDTAWMK